MLCLPEFNRPYLIDSLSAPIMIKHCWMFSGPMCDFLLWPLSYLEETTGPAYKLRINAFEFWVPSSWHILATDTETYQLDTVDIRVCAAINHIAVGFVPNEMKLRTLPISVVDFADEMRIVHPMINSKGIALVHPVGPISEMNAEIISVMIGPNDLYKSLEGKLVGDLFS